MAYPVRACKQGRLAATYSLLVPSRSTARPSIHPINRTAAQPDLVALPVERRREQKKKTREREKKSRPSHRQAAGPPIFLPHRLYGTSEIGGFILKHQGRDGSVTMELVRGEGGAKQILLLLGPTYRECAGAAHPGGQEQDRSRRNSRNETVVHPRKSDAVSSYVPTLKPCRMVPSSSPPSSYPRPGATVGRAL